MIKNQVKLIKGTKNYFCEGLRVKSYCYKK